MAKEKMTLAEAKSVIIKNLPEKFHFVDENREALYLLSEVFEPAEALLSKNSALEKELEAVRNSFLEMCELKKQAEKELQDTRKALNETQKSIMQSKKYRFVRNPDKAYSITDFEDGEILTFVGFPNDTVTRQNGYAVFRGYDDVHAINLTEVVEISVAEGYLGIIEGKDIEIAGLRNAYRNRMLDVKSMMFKAVDKFAQELKCGVPQETGFIRCSGVDEELVRVKSMIDSWASCQAKSVEADGFGGYNDFYHYCTVLGCEKASGDCWRTCPESTYNKTKLEAYNEMAMDMKGKASSGYMGSVVKIETILDYAKRKSGEDRTI